MEMYSTHNKGKSVIAKRFIRTLQNKSYKYLISISKNMYINKLDNIVNKYNNTYHSAIKMKPVDVKSNTYVDKHILKVKIFNIFCKRLHSKLVCCFCDQKKLKILCHGHTLLVILKVKKLLERFTKKNCKKQIKKSLELKK